MKAVLATVAVAALTATASAQIFSSSFEGGDAAGFAGSGDWELGIPTGVDGTGLGGFGGPEPTGGNTGDWAWGTVIGGLHNPSTVSNLSQTFDFSGFTGVTLSFQEWLDSGGNTFDMAKVFVNGNEEYLADGGPTTWRNVTLDLSAYDGLAAVTIDFQFETTGVVERVGWYIDDVEIRGIPAPGAVALAGFAGLAAVRRRR